MAAVVLELPCQKSNRFPHNDIHPADPFPVLARLRIGGNDVPGLIDFRDAQIICRHDC